MGDKRFCVYLHKTMDGLVFYVGRGSLKRALRKELSKQKGKGTSRGAAYSAFVASLNYEYDVEIPFTELTKEESCTLEVEMFEKYQATLVNARKPNSYTDIKLNKDYLNNVFKIDENSPSGIVWNINIVGYRNNHVRRIGDVAGYASKCFWTVCSDGKAMLVHRVILTMLGHDLTGMVVDHIDGNPLNNRIENLRIVTHAVNARNTESTQNPNGVKGVVFEPETKDYKSRWRALWTDLDGKIRSKSFSTHKYGYEGAFNLAVQARLEAIENLNKLGAGYSDRHLSQSIPK